MFPIISTISQAAGIIIDKIVLTRRRVELKVFIPLLFLFLFLTSGVLYPVLGKIEAKFFTPYYLIIFVLMIVLAIVWNVLYYKGAQAEKVHEFELILMSQPLVTILMADVFFADERNWAVTIAALIAAFALLVAHFKKEHLEFSPTSAGLIVAVVLISAELILTKVLLNVLSPVALYTIRTAILFLFFHYYYRPHYSKVANQNTWLILATASLGTVQMVTKFYGFEKYGIVYTSLILILAPVLVHVASTFMLHERMKLKQTICGLVILASVVYATILGS